jgi:hypothetical protein
MAGTGSRGATDVVTGARSLALLAGAALLVFGARCAVAEFAANRVPVWDQLVEADYYESLVSGTLTLRGLAAVHNEHHLFTTRLVSSLLFGLCGYWDPKAELVASAAVRGVEIALILAIASPLVPVRRRPGLVLLLLAVGMLPLSPFNLLSGFQVQFWFAEAFALVALALLSRSLDADTVAVASIALLAAFLSMATGILAAAAAAAALLGRAVAARRAPRPLPATVALMAALAFSGFLLTPRMVAFNPSSLREILGTLARGLAFPLMGSVPWLLLSQVPLVLLLARSLRDRSTDAGDWTVLALGAWSLMTSGAIAVGRGGLAPGPSEQHFDTLALGLVWNYLALVRLTCRSRFRAPGWRLLPGLWALAGILLLGGHVAARSLPALEEAHRVAPAVEARFAEALRSGDWRQHSTETLVALGRLRQGDNHFLYEPAGRYTLYPDGLRFLARDRRRAVLLFSPELTGRGRGSLAARSISLASSGWLLWLGLGALCVGQGLTPARGRSGRPPAEER